jgi:CheY-like chemotaxis protein
MLGKEMEDNIQFNQFTQNEIKRVINSTSSSKEIEMKEKINKIIPETNPFLNLEISKEKIRKILVVEDDEAIRFLISCSLKYENYEVLEAENGFIGFEMAQKFQPDLILSDLMMPLMDGYEFLAKLKEAPETSLIPFIFLSSVNTPGSFRLSKELGANDFIVKPFNSKEVIPVIKEIIKKQSIDSG